MAHPFFSKKLFLNVGCGSSCHPDWVNLDLIPSHSLATACDLRRGIPYDNDSVDICYSSHVLEHLDRRAGAAFLAEQHRVLKPGGIIRVVVPDLETICRNYLKFLTESITGEQGAEFRYDYSVLELFDQTIRRERGGELGKLWASGTITDVDFVLSRHGEEARPHIRTPASTPCRPSGLRRWLTEKIKAGTAEGWLAAVREGLFRNSGEIHRAMYDRFSLTRALRLAGFTNIRVCTYGESRIAEFPRFGLDGNEHCARKPDSLYLEATK